MQSHFFRRRDFAALVLVGIAGTCFAACAVHAQETAAPPAPADTPAPLITLKPSADLSAPTPAPVPVATPDPGPIKLSSAVENSVVKVFSTKRYPDPFKPWTKQAPSEVTGSGAVIDGKRIITNAHVVLYASQIQVQANQSGDKVSATVEAIAPGIDLAVLKLDDESFFDTHKALPIAKTLPDIKDAVMVYGYPQGGSSLAITKGIVSRIEFTSYNLPVSGLRIQIDAAINPGNSGGPAVDDDKMIGLAFSHLGGAENIGYIIPSEEIELFLHDVADGHYDGKPLVLEEFQTLENPALRAFLKLGKSAEGIIVSHPYSDDPSYPLKAWDVISRIGDTPVDNEGMVKLENGLRVRFSYMAQKVAHDGKMPLTIIREGKEMAVTVPVPSQRPQVIPELDGDYPSYFICGPIVFAEATSSYLGSIASGSRAGEFLRVLSYMGSPLVTRMSDKPTFEGERLVVVSSPFFPHKLSRGYSNPTVQVVKSINGHDIKNLANLVATLRDLKDEFVTVAFDSRISETLVMPRAEMLASTDDILTDNGVRSQGSPDMMAVWNTKKMP